MANNFANVLTLALNTLTQDELAQLTQVLVSMGTSHTQVSTPSALAPAQESAPQTERKHIDYDALKANAEPVSIEVRKLKNAVTIEYVTSTSHKCAKRRLRDAGFVYDETFELPETYAKDCKYGKAGEHKHGAWVWGGKATDFSKWCKLNSKLVISVDELNEQYDKGARKQERKERKAQ